jgi:hypothetical protein
MSTWIDFFVYAALTVVFWGCIPAWSRFTIPVIADRNPDWLLSHPEVERRLTARRWFRDSCRAWTVLSLVALLAVQTGVWSSSLLAGVPRWEALKDLNSALFIIGLLFVAGCFLWFERWLRATVPRATRRQATLARRSFDDYVPRPVQLAVYGIVVLHLAVWLLVGVTGRYTTAGFWGMLAFQYAVAGVLLLMAVTSVRRKPSAVDYVFGSGYRRTEVRLAVACQLAPLLNGAARLYEQMGGATPDSLNRLSHLGLVGFVTALAVLVAMWPRQPEDGERSAPSSSSLRSLPSV